jgi:hypothetical protein
MRQCDDSHRSLAATFSSIRQRLIDLGADSVTIDSWAATYVNVAHRDWPNHPLTSALHAAVEAGFQVTLHRDASGEWHASTILDP